MVQPKSNNTYIGKALILTWSHLEQLSWVMLAIELEFMWEENLLLIDYGKIWLSFFPMLTVQERDNIKSWSLSDNKEVLLTTTLTLVTAFMELMLTWSCLDWLLTNRDFLSSGKLSLLPMINGAQLVVKRVITLQTVQLQHR